METELLNLFLSFLALAQKDPLGPATAGALLALASFLIFKAPWWKDRLDAFLNTKLRKRIAVGVMALAPGFITSLSGATEWDRALGTALVSLLVSQGVFLFFKDKDAAPPKDSQPPSAAAATGLVLLCVAGAGAAGLTGCAAFDKLGGQIKDVTEFAEASRDIANAAQPCFVDQFREAEDFCQGDAECEADVRAASNRIADLYDKANEFFCRIAPDASGCEPAAAPELPKAPKPKPAPKEPAAEPVKAEPAKEPNS